MSDPIVSPSDLCIYLGQPDINNTRAAMLIQWAQTLCESIVSPLPAGSEPVVLDVVARAYSNPLNVQGQSTTPFSITYGPVAGGLWLTRTNKATLRRLAGEGGAFTFDTMPATAGQNLPPWDEGFFIGDWGGVAFP